MASRKKGKSRLSIAQKKIRLAELFLCLDDPDLQSSGAEKKAQVSKFLESLESRNPPFSEAEIDARINEIPEFKKRSESSLTAWLLDYVDGLEGDPKAWVGVMKHLISHLTGFTDWESVGGAWDEGNEGKTRPSTTYKEEHLARAVQIAMQAQATLSKKAFASTGGHGKAEKKKAEARAVVKAGRVLADDHKKKGEEWSFMSLSRELEPIVGAKVNARAGTPEKERRQRKIRDILLKDSYLRSHRRRQNTKC